MVGLHRRVDVPQKLVLLPLVQDLEPQARHLHHRDDELAAPRLPPLELEYDGQLQRVDDFAVGLDAVLLLPQVDLEELYLCAEQVQVPASDHDVGFLDDV